jgi:hypothetical protein
VIVLEGFSFDQNLPIMAFTDTYTSRELERCSQYCLTSFPGLRGTFLGARDRAMLLLSTSIAFRGESARILQWSDLFMSEIPMDEVKDGYRVPVCIFAPMLVGL